MTKHSHHEEAAKHLEAAAHHHREAHKHHPAEPAVGGAGSVFVNPKAKGCCPS